MHTVGICGRIVPRQKRQSYACYSPISRASQTRAHTNDKRRAGDSHTKENKQAGLSVVRQAWGFTLRTHTNGEENKQPRRLLLTTSPISECPSHPRIWNSDRKLSWRLGRTHPHLKWTVTSESSTSQLNTCLDGVGALRTLIRSTPLPLYVTEANLVRSLVN